MLDRLNALLAGSVEVPQEALLTRVLHGVAAVGERMIRARTVRAGSCPNGPGCSEACSACPSETWVYYYKCTSSGQTTCCTTLGSDCSVPSHCSFVC